MKNTFFIGDTHFGHKDIIDFENRPFKDVEEMDQELIRRWNSIVEIDDFVFMIGDFSFYDKAKSMEIFNLLNGKITLIKGNHDIHSIEYYLDCGFYNVSEYPVILDGFWMVSHEPLYLNKNMPYSNIFGHVHGNEIYKDYSKHAFCACVERINYTPISFDRIKEKMQTQ